MTNYRKWWIKVEIGKSSDEALGYKLVQCASGYVLVGLIFLSKRATTEETRTIALWFLIDYKSSLFLQLSLEFQGHGILLRNSRDSCSAGWYMSNVWFKNMTVSVGTVTTGPPLHAFVTNCVTSTNIFGAASQKDIYTGKCIFLGSWTFAMCECLNSSICKTIKIHTVQKTCTKTVSTFCLC